METYIAPLLVSAIITYLMIFLIRPNASSINLIDRPSSRKAHNRDTPVIGGIAMYAGVIVGLLISSNEFNQLNYFILASAVVVVAGVLDDQHNTSSIFRLIVELLVAIIIVKLSSTKIESFGTLLFESEIILNEWSNLISVVAIIAGINAINMSDGIHGLAGGTSLITFIAILFLSIGSATQEAVLVTILFCSVIPVFLIKNLCIGIDKSKRIFMGDAGSMLLGFTIVWLLINLSQGEERSFAPVTALWLFALPLIEIGSVILRRLISGKSPIKADSLHTHHALIYLGLSEKNTLLVLLCFSLSMSLIGVLGELYGVAEWVMFVGFLLVSLVYLLLYLFIVRRLQTNKFYIAKAFQTLEEIQ